MNQTIIERTVTDVLSQRGLSAYATHVPTVVQTFLSVQSLEATTDRLAEALRINGLGSFAANPVIGQIADAIDNLDTTEPETPAVEGEAMRVKRRIDYFEVGDTVRLFRSISAARSYLTTTDDGRCWDLTAAAVNRFLDGDAEAFVAAERAAGRGRGWWVAAERVDDYFEPVQEPSETPRLDALMSEPSSFPIRPFEPFDKAQACDVIEAFLRGTHSEEDIDALLVLAGLKAETPVVDTPLVQSASDLQEGDRVVIPNRDSYRYDGRNRDAGGTLFSNLSRHWPAYGTVREINDDIALVEWDTPEDPSQPEVFADLSCLSLASDGPTDRTTITETIEQMEADLSTVPSHNSPEDLARRVAALEVFASRHGFTA